MADAYGALRPWLERIAASANLCVSIFHISELARWGDQETANAMAAWYESSSVVWVKSTQTVEEEEGTYWTLRAAGVHAKPVNPFSRTLVGAFHRLTPRAVAALLGQENQVRSLLNAARQMGHERQEAFMASAAQHFRDDLSWADANGLTVEQRRERVARNTRVRLREIAHSVHRDLTATGDARYAGRPSSALQIHDALVNLYETDPTAMPNFRVQQSLWPGFRAAVHRRSPGSQADLATTRSAFEDNQHASVGAAYCDVFTCDGEVAEWLGNLRASLGRRPQMTARNYPGGSERFVRDLIATIQV